MRFLLLFEHWNSFLTSPYVCRPRTATDLIKFATAQMRSDAVKRFTQEAVIKGAFHPHPQAGLWVWNGTQFSHGEAAMAIMDKFGRPQAEDFYALGFKDLPMDLGKPMPALFNWTGEDEVEVFDIDQWIPLSSMGLRGSPEDEGDRVYGGDFVWDLTTWSMDS